MWTIQSCWPLEIRVVRAVTQRQRFGVTVMNVRFITSRSKELRDFLFFSYYLFLNMCSFDSWFSYLSTRKIGLYNIYWFFSFESHVFDKPSYLPYSILMSLETTSRTNVRDFETKYMYSRLLTIQSLLHYLA